VRTAFLLTVVVLAGTGGDIVMTHVMKTVSRGERWTWRAAPRRIYRALRQTQMWLGFGLMVLAFLSFITVLSWAPVSLVVPATAANYIVGTLGAKLLLKERVNRTRWLGMLLVAAGVVLVCAA
jgi:drug/metabolite transporter (DMT)-like permease